MKSLVLLAVALVVTAGASPQGQTPPSDAVKQLRSESYNDRAVALERIARSSALRNDPDVRNEVLQEALRFERHRPKEVDAHAGAEYELQLVRTVASLGTREGLPYLVRRVGGNPDAQHGIARFGQSAVPLLVNNYQSPEAIDPGLLRMGALMTLAEIVTTQSVSQSVRTQLRGIAGSAMRDADFGVVLGAMDLVMALGDIELRGDIQSLANGWRLNPAVSDSHLKLLQKKAQELIGKIPGQPPAQ